MSGDAWVQMWVATAGKGTPEEREAAVRCLSRLSRAVADGAAGLRTVLQALALDDEETRCD